MGRALARLLVAALVVVLTMSSLALADQGSSRVRLPRTAPGDVAATTVVVVRGDHLWRISERHLDAVLGRTAADAEVSPYWRRVIEVNRDGLRSGDPDLIYPGEVVTLPEAEVSGGR
jgi:nucleoid-associated protein YgaU